MLLASRVTQGRANGFNSVGDFSLIHRQNMNLTVVALLLVSLGVRGEEAPVYEIRRRQRGVSGCLGQPSWSSRLSGSLLWASTDTAGHFQRNAERVIQARRPPCPRQATSQPVMRYLATSGGSRRSTTLGFADL